MKKFAALICTLALLTSLSACGVEKPDLQEKASSPKSSEGSSATESEKKKIMVADSKIKGHLTDRFHVDADIIGGDKTEYPSYMLNKIGLTEDQIAAIIMTDPDYNRSERDDGAAEYNNSQEKLIVDLNGSGSGLMSLSPNLTYALDKGKEYESVVRDYGVTESMVSEESQRAVAQVAAKLDKLGLEYGDLSVTKLNHDHMNSLYDFIFEFPDDINAGDGDVTVVDDHYSLSGKDNPLDKNFRFTKDDSCFAIKGNMKIKGIPVKGSAFADCSISAAVSARGIEYLHISDLYTSDNGFGDPTFIPPEKAVETVFEDYEAFPDKDKYEVFISKVSMTYIREKTSAGNGDPKQTLTPVWNIEMNINNKEEGYNTVTDCDIYANSGELISSFFQSELFDTNNIPEGE